MIKELKPYFDEIIKHAYHDGAHIGFPEIVDCPFGEKQDYYGNLFSHIYVDQQHGYCEDEWFGYIYYPIEDKYLKVYFTM